MSEQSMISGEAVADEIRVHQSVHIQRAMPVLLAGNALCVFIFCYIDWQAVLASGAVYGLGLEIVLLLPMLRSYFRLRRRPRPAQVSKRRIRTLEVYSALMGVTWAVAIFLVLPDLDKVEGLTVITAAMFLCYGAAALTPSFPLASASYVTPVILAVAAGGLTYEVLDRDVMVLVLVAGGLAILQTVVQNWQDALVNVRIGLERLRAEAELHQREVDSANRQKERQAEAVRTMRAMIEAIPFPLVLTRANGALEASEQAAEQFGIPVDQLADKNISDFFVNPSEQERMVELQDRQGRIDEYEVQFRDNEGKPFWALLSSRPLKYQGEDSWLNAIYVIDDRKRVEEELLEAKQRAEEANETVVEKNQMLETVSAQLAKYISPQLYAGIFSGEQTVEIASKRQKLTVFFSDIADFTETTDQLESEELTGLINQYLTEMSAIALAHGATIDKFVGDAIMLYFGDPESHGIKEDAGRCVRMAIAMQRRMRELRTEWLGRGLEQPFELRIGINTGYCTVGNFGSEDRMDHTIIGSAVNLASRLQSHAEVGGILLANETHSLVKEEVLAEEGEVVTVKGFSKPIRTFRVAGLYDDMARAGRIIHRQQDGLSLTVDREKLADADKAGAIAALEEVITQLRE